MKVISGVQAREIWEKLNDDEQAAIQEFINLSVEAQFDDTAPIVGIYDNFDNTVTDAAGFNNVRIVLRDKEGNDWGIAGLCNAYSDVDKDFVKSAIKTVVDKRDQILNSFSNNGRVRYPSYMKDIEKFPTIIRQMIALGLPLCDQDMNEVKAVVRQNRLIRERLEYMQKYKPYKEYVNMYLQVQPYNSFLLAMKNKIDNHQELTDTMVQTLEKGMVGDWKERIRKLIEEREDNEPIIAHQDARLAALLESGSLGMLRGVVLSFKKQVRSGKPLSPKQLETLTGWEHKFLKKKAPEGEVVAN